jgi:hypothetical protein
MVGHYERMLSILSGKFPGVIDAGRCCKVAEGAGDDNTEIRLWIRYTGNIILLKDEMPPGLSTSRANTEWRERENGKMVAVRDYLLEQGYQPKLDTVRMNTLLSPYCSKLMYSFPVGERCVVDRTSGRKRTVRKMPLEDRVFVGFSRLDCELRELGW